MGYFYRPPVQVEDYDPKAEYTSTELEAFATAWLKKDARAHKGDKSFKTNILFEESLRIKRQREVLVGDGVVDEALTQLMQDKSKKPGVFSGDGQRFFNRTHPRGRRVNTPEARKLYGASYYSN